MNPFEKHGITRLSASSINTYADDAAWWAAKYLLGVKDEVSPRAWVGHAVEAGLDWWLFQRHNIDALEESLTKAHERFEQEAQGEVRDDIDAAREDIEPMLKRAIEQMAAYPAPVTTQLQGEHWIEGIEVPILYYIDYPWPDFILDLKTTARMPSEPRNAHLRQVSLYAKAKNRGAKILYVTPAKSRVFTLTQEEIDHHYLWACSYAHRIRGLLATVGSGEEAAKILPPNLDHFYLWKSEPSKAALKQYWS